MKPLVLWISQTRRMALNRLERIRLQAKRPWLTRLADRAQRRLMSKKYRHFMVRGDDTRRPFYPYAMAIGAPISFARGDTLVCAGSGWGQSNIGALTDLKSRIGFRMALLCHDLIPLLFPQFYRRDDVDLFEKYMLGAMAAADCIVVGSRRVQADCRDYCTRHGIAHANIVVSPLGFDVGAPPGSATLPAGLHPGRFAMLVSTIEPRKGHRLLYNVWRRLLAEGVPQTAEFKLVFAGRPGWMVDDLLKDLASDPLVAGRILTVRDVNDEMLAALYAAAAFCVYPSMYEGYGLPVVEAFSHGKAVIASTGGALPELAQGFSPCLDPTDEQAWFETIKLWIAFPQARAAFEQKIRAEFRHPTWSEAATAFFAVVGVPMQAGHGSRRARPRWRPSPTMACRAQFGGIRVEPHDAVSARKGRHGAQQPLALRH